ncbi:DUF317 domain-containing protein [Streptomyces sp. NPDC020898]|uniref:DUF317 domain-containing protein n=1 Tax=Streptomyces sp. NPDC020898 TaxID=3365101 RepID=UPI0037AFEB83
MAGRRAQGSLPTRDLDGHARCQHPGRTRPRLLHRSPRPLRGRCPGRRDLLRPDDVRPQDVHLPLLAAGWRHTVKTDGTQYFRSSDGYGVLEHAYVRKNPAAHVWSAWGGPPDNPLWKATFSSAVPASLVAAFASSLASTVGLHRAARARRVERSGRDPPAPHPSRSPDRLSRPQARTAAQRGTFAGGHRVAHERQGLGTEHRPNAPVRFRTSCRPPQVTAPAPLSAVEEHHRICPCTPSTSSPNSSTCPSTNDG